MPSKLLVADDSVTIQRVIELTFADEDVDVIAVANGRQAVQRIERDPPDIVLADVSMPQGDGYEVATFVKGSPGLSHIPVVLLTGAFEPVDESRAREVGCDAVLAKPFEPQAVINRVKELLNARRPRSEEREAGPSPAALLPVQANQSEPGPSQPPFEAIPSASADAPSRGAATSTADEALRAYFDRLDTDFGNAAPPAAPDHVEPPAAAAATHGPGAEPARQGIRPSTATLVEPPQLADSFAALLAAEQGLAPAPIQPYGEAFVDEVARRVIERISKRLTRELISEVVFRLADRLIREELEDVNTAK